MLHHPKYLSSLSPIEQDHLANLLILPSDRLTTAGQPSSAWLATQRHLISNTIPTVLRGPQSLFGRLVSATTINPRAVLCAAHSGLNSRLIRAVFSLLTAEVGRKARSLRRFARHPGRYHVMVDDEKLVRGLVDRLTGVAALWLESEEFSRTNPDLFTRHNFVDGGCEACILAVVGGDEDVLRDMWAVVVGRTHKKRVAPVFKGLIAAWVENRLDGQEFKRESEKLSKVVKRVRRAVWRRRHKKRSPRSASSSKSRSGRGRARENEYGSATGSGGDLVAWTRMKDQAGDLSEHASLGSSCGPGWNESDEGEPFVQTAVEYDVFLCKRETSLSQRPDVFNVRETIRTPFQHSLIAAEEEEKEDWYHPYFRNRQPALHQHRHPDALDTNSNTTTTSNTLRIPHASAVKPDRDNNDDEDDDPFDKLQLGASSRTRLDHSDGKFQALHVRSSMALGLTARGDGTHYTGSTTRAKSLALDLFDDVSQSDETYNPAQWTDVSVATRESGWDCGQVLGCCGSSSVYSNTDTAMPHPPVSSASTIFSGNGRPSALVSNVELAWTTWPNPFGRSSPTISITTGSGSSSETSSCTSPSSSWTLTGTVGESNKPTSLSSDEFQRALNTLEKLSLVDEPGQGNCGPMGISDGTILPWESISVVGHCVCMTRVELHAKRPRVTFDM